MSEYLDARSPSDILFAQLRRFNERFFERFPEAATVDVAHAYARILAEVIAGSHREHGAECPEEVSRYDA
jgi:hypothetical protein